MKITSVISVILTLALMLCTLFGCTSDEGGGTGQGGQDQGGADQAVILSYNLICPTGYAGEGFSKIFYSLAEMGNVYVEMGNDSTAPSQREILFGRTNRPLSDEAYDKLSRIERTSDLHARYVILSDGSSVAIAYDTDPR